jgi:hypothetical protein
MPKAVINLRSGSVVTIEGSQREVTDMLVQFREHDVGRTRVRSASRAEGPARPTPAVLLHELIDDGYFNEPKELGAVRATLQEKGHFYPATSLSPLLLRLVRRKTLRRIKDKKHWVYVR